jgi:hypothetical protein
LVECFVSIILSNPEVILKLKMILNTKKGKYTMKYILRYLTITMTLLTLAACGGGGGGSSDTGAANQNPPTTTKTTAKLTITQTGSLPASTTISGADFTITLPADVTPATTNGTVASGVITASGTFAGSTLAPQVTYTAATPGAPGTLRVILASSTAAGVSQTGEIATITLQLANGAAPTAASFGQPTAVSVVDTAQYATISGMGVSVGGVTLQ